jgi:hypothetical protein
VEQTHTQQVDLPDPHPGSCQVEIGLTACEVECRTGDRGKWSAVHDFSSDILHGDAASPVRGRTATVLGRQRKTFHMIAAEDFAVMVSRALSTNRATDQTLAVYGPEAYRSPMPCKSIVRCAHRVSP